MAALSKYFISTRSPMRRFAQGTHRSIAMMGLCILVAPAPIGLRGVVSLLCLEHVGILALGKQSSVMLIVCLLALAIVGLPTRSHSRGRTPP